MSLDYWVEFFDDLQNVRGRSRNTVLAYRRDLELYEEFKKTGRDIKDIFAFMTEKQLSTRSQARVISSLRTFFRFCESRGSEVPELQNLRPPKVKTGLPKALTYEEFQKLYDACAVDNPYRTARNQVTLLLLFGLGCRVSELINLNIQDYNETDAWLKIVGKGGKERLIPLTEVLQRELKDYLHHIRTYIVRENTPSILVNDRGRRPSRVDIWRWLAAWSSKAGFSEPISPHKFRHGCATALLEAGADLRSIQVLLGHSSIQTTQIYTSVTSQKTRETIDQHHPLSKVRPPEVEA
ncbi:MAG: tyrosine-type recombinase/integrase [Bdellovibrionaceae bacterium]|nr:tyrosine-type recombinase/integrase [Pseudobdellovibrionaceae bacterium]